ncbi:macrophage mannose receptor 1 [Tachysurus ichikawai]
MKLSHFLLLCLTGVVPVTRQTIRHEYFMITIPSTWADAHTYCQSKYLNLATVQTSEDWYRLNAAAESKGLAATGWVGMHINVKDWYWSNTVVYLLNTTSFWGPGQPDNSGGREECCAIDSSGYWADYPCRNLKPFICFTAATGAFSSYSTLMSWYGGQTYCRTHHTDLARATTITQNNQLQQLVAAQGTSWIGLFRDTWMWVDSTMPLLALWAPGLPNNVDHDDNCAITTNNQIVDRECNTLYNFFCHIQYKVIYKVMKLQIQGDESVFDPAVQSAILQQVVQKLKDYGIMREMNVAWRVHPDGNIFHKKHI